LVLDNDPERKTLTVTGVMANVPDRSHLQFDLLGSYVSHLHHNYAPPTITSFYWPFGWTYVRVPDAAAAQQIEAGLPAFAERHRGAELAQQYTPTLERLTDIHLHTPYANNPTPSGTASTVYLFGSIALFVLLLACINFMNLATARSTERAKEVGVRKSIGAGRRQLIGQFLGESVVLSALALGVALGLTGLLLPAFNDLAGTAITLDLASNAGGALVLLGIILVTGLVAGSYPALFLSSFEPSKVLKGSFSGATRGAGLRKGLVVVQFTISIVLIAGTAIAFQQLRYMQTARLGFDEERVLSLPFDGITVAPDEQAEYDNTPTSEADFETLTTELLRSPRVAQVTSATVRPGLGYGGYYQFEAEGLPDGLPDDEGDRDVYVQSVGDGYFEMFDLDLITGRAFSSDRPADVGEVERIQVNERTMTLKHTGRAFVVNETALRRIGWTPQEALGKPIRVYLTENGINYQDYAGTVVGVVEDYHQTSLRAPIEPQVFMPARSPAGFYINQRHLLVKAAGNDVQAAVADVRNVWSQLGPERPFDVTFLDAALDAQYRQEQRLSRIMSAFAGLAILIACLGLFGLAAFTAERRTKEIGVRKVLGASAMDIVRLLSKDFVGLVAIAAVVATPIAWAAMHQWLSDFAYRIDVGVLSFVAAGTVALVIALLTVSGQALRAARKDPATALRYE
jgi:putative ABC transport system permease protein